MREKGRFANAVFMSLIVGCLCCAWAFPQAPQTPQAPQPQAGGPKMSVSQTVYDFKEIPAAKDALCDFIVQNTGDAILEIKEVRASCGCTAVVADKKLVPPGESSKIAVRFNPGNSSANFEKSITVTTNDPTTPVVVLKIKGTVVADVTVEPSYVRFENAPRDRPSESQFTVTLKNPDSSGILEIKPDVPYLSCQSQKKDDRGRTVVGLTLLPDKLPANMGDFMSGTVVVKTSLANQPEIRVPVSIRMLPDYVATPSRLQLFKVKPNTPTQIDIEIKSARGLPFTITNIQSTNTFVKPSVAVNGQAQNRVTVAVEIKAESNMPVLSGLVNVQIGSTTVGIPFRVTVDTTLSAAEPPDAK